MGLIKKLSFTQKTGLLTELHSDTIFVHFCWRMLHGEGTNTLNSFLNEFSTKPIFTVSNAFPGIREEIFVPIPLVNLPSLIGKIDSKKESIINFLKLKRLKKFSSVSITDFNLLLNGRAKEFAESLLAKLDNPGDAPSPITDLRTRVKISRESYSPEEGKLFSQESKSIGGNHQQIKNDEIRWNIFIKVIDLKAFENEEFKCEKYLKDVFTLGFGKKKNIGFGEFKDIRLEDFEQFEQPKDGSNGFVSLSNYIPSTDDGLKSFKYKQFLKYPKLGEEYSVSKDPFKRPIVFLMPGSVFYTDTIREYYGRCTNHGEVSSSKSEVIQNGIAFTLRANLPI